MCRGKEELGFGGVRAHSYGVFKLHATGDFCVSVCDDPWQSVLGVNEQIESSVLALLFVLPLLSFIAKEE